MSDARRFIDRHGFSWQLCELWSSVDPVGLGQPADRPAPGNEGWLYFFSRGTTLVLRDYPRGWEELGWRELEQLLERAEVLGSDRTNRGARAHGATLRSRAASSHEGGQAVPSLAVAPLR